MNRRIALVVSVIGLNLMACCCGGAGNHPFPAAPKQAKAKVDDGPQKKREAKRTKFNQALIDKYNLHEREFSSLQYYLATDLVIFRELSKEDSARPQKGKLVQSKGEVIEEIGITSDTPGIFVAAEKGKDGTQWLTMSFEQGTQMLFQRRANEDVYTATSFGDGADVTVTVKFLDNTYKASAASVKAAYLVVAEESLENFEKKRKNLKGVEVIP